MLMTTFTYKGKHQREFLKGWRSWWASLSWARWPWKSTLCVSSWQLAANTTEDIYNYEFGLHPYRIGLPIPTESNSSHGKYWLKCNKKKFGVNFTSRFPSKSLGWVTKTSDNYQDIAIKKWRGKKMPVLLGTEEQWLSKITITINYFLYQEFYAKYNKMGINGSRSRSFLLC